MIPDWLKDLQPPPESTPPEPPLPLEPPDLSSSIQPLENGIAVSEDDPIKVPDEDEEPSSIDLLAALAGGEPLSRSSPRIEPAGAALGLIDSIKQFEDSIDDGGFVAMRVTAQGQNMILRLKSVAMKGRELVEIDGVTNTGQHVRLLQHITQINLFLFRMSGDESLPTKRKGGRRQ